MITLRIALCQKQIEWENKRKNIDQAIVSIKECKQFGADLCLFPEMSLTGFSMNTSKTREDDRHTVELFKSIACDNKIAIGIGWVEATGEKSYNCYSVISKNGEELLTYRKIHSFRFGGEDKQFISGNEIVSVQLEDIRVTPFICYDLRFPEIFRAARDYTDVFIIPANWPKVRREHWKVLLRARAIENQAYVFGINCVGEIGGLLYSGDSMIVSPDGTVLELLEGKEGVLFADIEPDRLKIREDFPVRKDCKGDLYISALSDAYGKNE